VRVLTDEEGLEEAEDGAERERMERDRSLVGLVERKEGLKADDDDDDDISIGRVSSLSKPTTMLTGAGRMKVEFLGVLLLLLLAESGRALCGVLLLE
jgi:hypothetical protein